MDISYLMFLQRVREATGGIFSGIAMTVTALGEPAATYLLLAWVYWCADKAAGQLAAFHVSIACTYNTFLKSICKIERPWVRDARIVPVEAALAGAGGYSFPSGHTARAAAVWGSVGAALWRGREKALSVFCWLIVLAVAFSRNFLGVHTPQDVAVSLLVGVVLLLILPRAQAWAEGKAGRDLILCAAGCILCFLPMLRAGCIANAGAGMGFLIGWLLERRYVRFAACGDWRHGLKRFLPGAACLLFLLQTLQTFFAFVIRASYAGFFASFVLTVFIMAGYPLVFRVWETNTAAERKRLAALCLAAALTAGFLMSLAGYRYVHREAAAQETEEQAQEQEAAAYPLIPIEQEFDTMRVIAHRGYSAVYPENTLAAFAGAIDIGADYIELDVQMTSDGVIVVFHDGDLARLTGSEGTIADSTYEQLSRLTVDGEKIPTLQEALELIRNSSCNVYLELKDIGERDGYIEQTLQTAEACGMRERCIFASFQYDYLRQIKAADPDVPTLYITSSGAVSLPAEYPAEFYGLNVESVSAELVQAIHEAGGRAFVWTLETPAQIGIVRRMGADGVVTNRAGMARVFVHPEYECLADDYESSFALPGLYGKDLPELCRDMVVQGLVKAGQYIAVSAYSRSGEHNSILYLLNTGGQLIDIVDLGFQAHTGGIACDEERGILWVTGPDGMVYALDWGEITDGAYQGEIRAEFDAGLQNHNGSRVASFLTYDHGELFVGSYVDGGPGRLRRYAVTDDLQTELLSEAEIPQRIQGITFAWDEETQNRYLLLSQGYQTEDSALLAFLYSETCEAYTDPVSALVMPEGMEQIDMSGNGLYALFESASRPYRETARIPNDQVYLLRWPGGTGR